MPKPQKLCSRALVQSPNLGSWNVERAAHTGQERNEKNPAGPAGFHFAYQLPRSGFCSPLPCSSSHFPGSF